MQNTQNSIDKSCKACDTQPKTRLSIGRQGGKKT